MLFVNPAASTNTAMHLDRSEAPRQQIQIEKWIIWSELTLIQSRFIVLMSNQIEKEVISLLFNYQLFWKKCHWYCTIELI